MKQKHQREPQRGFYDPTSKVIYLQTYIGHQHWVHEVHPMAMSLGLHSEYNSFVKINKPAFKMLFTNLKCH